MKKHNTNALKWLHATKWPLDNSTNERFNQTLQNEFLALGNFHSNPKIFNQRLTEWLIEYNFRRPHETLGYKTPIEFGKVLRYTHHVQSLDKF